MQDQCPSWLYPVKQGATTIWERWDSYTLANGFQSSGMNSFNHYAYGSIVSWIFHTMVGINYDTNNPGYKNIIMKPVPDMHEFGIKEVNAFYDCNTSKIQVKSHLDSTQSNYDFVIHAGTTATFTLLNVKFKDTEFIHFIINGKEILIDLTLEDDDIQLNDDGTFAIVFGTYSLVATK